MTQIMKGDFTMKKILALLIALMMTVSTTAVFAEGNPPSGGPGGTPPSGEMGPPPDGTPPDGMGGGALFFHCDSAYPFSPVVATPSTR